MSETLICFAVKEEAKFFTPPAGVKTLVTGMGGRNAIDAFEKRLRKSAPKQVFTSGFAGGLSPRLKANAIVFWDDDQSPYRAKFEQHGGIPVKFHCARRVAITAEEKQRLWRATGADVVEMESAYIEGICREKNIPCSTVRVISDTAFENLPLDFNTLMTPSNQLDFTKLGFRLLRSPRKIVELLSFQQKTTASAKALGEFLLKVLA